jgi:hypothetical protein
MSHDQNFKNPILDFSAKESPLLRDVVEGGHTRGRRAIASSNEAPEELPPS